MQLSHEISVAASNLLKEKEYWKRRFSGFSGKSSFPYDFGLNDREGNTGCFVFNINGDDFIRLKQVSNGSDELLLTLFVTATGILLQKYTGEEEVVLATPIDRVDLVKQALNKVIPLRLALKQTGTVREAVYHVKERVAEAVSYQNYPWLQIAKDLQLSSSDGLSIFDVAVVLENIQDLAYLDELLFSAAFIFNRLDDCIEGRIFFDQNKYNYDTIAHIYGHLLIVLDTMLNGFDKALDELSLLSETEEAEVRNVFNNTEVYAPFEGAIPGVFVEMVQQYPDRIAVACAGNYITFSELNRRADIVAHALIQQLQDTGNVIGVLAERSPEFVIAVMGILKAGKAYLPLDEQLPQDRMMFMLKENKVCCILAGKSQSNNHLFVNTGITVYCTADFPEPLTGIVNPPVTPQHLAYVIYTSGTTGNPKGVKISHANVGNIIYGLRERVFNRYKHKLNLGLISNFSFDASVQHLFGALLLGNTLVIATHSERQDGHNLIGFFNKYSIDISDGAPVHIKLMNEGLANAQVRSLSVKHFIIGGEALYKKDLSEFYRLVDHDCIWFTNVYGPTECTVNASSYEIEKKSLGHINDIVPIGKPFPNYQMLILSNSLQLLPKGIPGEIYIGGAGVSEGYVNESLDSGCFISNIQGTQQKWYRTGDRGKWLNDGNISYLGRADNQVKLRGYRIELNDIRSNILTYDKVKEARVKLIEKDDEQYLCAYVSGEGTIDLDDLRNHLKGCIPFYMIPAYIIEMNKWPLMPSGKINTDALPLPGIANSSDSQKKQPANETETALLKIWQVVLNSDDIGVCDNFFNIGGDSIKLIKLMNMIKTKLNVPLELTEIYGNETIQKLAQLAAQKKDLDKSDDRDIYQKLEEMKSGIINNYKQ